VTPNELLNCATGAAYWSTALPLLRPTTTPARLTAAARRMLERQYATIEIADSVARMAGHALSRTYHGRLQTAVNALQDDVLNPPRALPRDNGHRRSTGRFGVGRVDARPRGDQRALRDRELPAVGGRQEASLLAGGDGRAVQQIALHVPANRLHLVSVDKQGVARLKLRPRF
jgi:hypothetical protein